MWYYIEYQSFDADAKYRVPTIQNRFEKFDAVIYQENILSSWVFRRETASGFYPWGNVDSPRKRVAEGMCGWRHGNSFPMTQSAQSHRQMRSIPLCPKAVFYVFVFDSTHDSGNNAESIPRNVPLNHRNAPTCWGGEIKKRKSGVISFFCSRDEGIRTLDLCNVTAAL